MNHLRFSMFASLLLTSFGVFLLQHERGMDVGEPEPMYISVLAVLFAATVAVALFLSMSAGERSRSVSSGAAIGLGAVGFLFCISFSLLCLYAMLWGARLESGLVALIVAGFVVHIWAIVAGIRVSRRLRQTLGLSIAAALIAPVIVVGSWRGIIHSKKLRRERAEEASIERSRAAFATLRQKQICLLQYSTRFAEPQFPANLADAGCGSSNEWTDRGYVFSYALEFSDNRPNKFYLVGKPENPNDYYEIGGDQSGILSSTLPGIGLNWHMGILIQAYDCLVRFHRAQSGGSYPRNLGELNKDGSSKPCFGSNTWKYKLEGNTLNFGYYRLEYSPKYDGDNVVGFVLQLRPVQYGGVKGQYETTENVLRSYYFDSAESVIHGTGYNRPATLSDPPIPPCERPSFFCQGGRPGSATGTVNLSEGSTL